MDPHPDNDETWRAAERLRGWLDSRGRVFVLTGAGCSTGSGIPDYRGADGAWKRSPPIMYQAFVSDAAAYRRYWARSHVGWPRLAAARPNGAHAALAHWQARGRLAALVTQNVDGLHQQAGSRGVIDLHGRLDTVTCLDCGRQEDRDAVQASLARANAGWLPGAGGPAPDGDADIEPAAAARFVAPACAQCGGRMKPDVVFFGENVPRARYLAAQAALDAADALLVVGSSLMVYSGFRFVRDAHGAGKPIAVLTRGRTRADELRPLKLDADCAATLVLALAEVEVVRPQPAANSGR